MIIFVIANLVLVYIYIYIYIYTRLRLLLQFFHLSIHVLSLFFLYTHVSYTCMQSIISISHKNTLMSFVSSFSEIQVVNVYLS